MAFLECSYLRGWVELTGEREDHIRERHPELLPEYREELTETLAGPEVVRRSKRFSNARLFSRWFDTIKGGKHVVVVVVSDAAVAGRHWIITAYVTGKPAEGDCEWKAD